MKKGQVSTEYLVILAVVLVIALVVVFLVSQGTTVSTGVTETQSRNYWNAQTPLSVVGYKLSGTSLELEITNRDAQEVTLVAVDVDGTERFSTETTFTAGQTRTVTATSVLTAACTAGDSHSFDLDFTYDRGELEGILQDGQTDVVATCS